MIVLAFDTAHAPGVAVCDKGVVRAACALERAERQSEALHEAIAAMLKKAKLKSRQVQAVSVGLGPGSFTGVRIGVSAAAVWAWAQKIPLYGFSRLEAVARVYLEDHPDQKSVWVIENAGRGNVYEARYSRGRDGKPTQKIAPRLRPKKDRDFTESPDSSRVAAALAEMASEKGRKPIDPFRIQPMYLYPKDCNVT